MDQASRKCSQMMGAAQGRRPPNDVEQHSSTQMLPVAGVEIRFLAALEAGHGHLKQFSQQGKGVLPFLFPPSCCPGHGET